MAVVSWFSNDNEATKNKVRDDNVAPIELDSTSASKTYYTGERFVLDSDGILYKATATISQGSAFVTSGSGANCEVAVPISDALKSIEDDLDGLGTAATKNSTSVVTQSTDLVESGAVYEALGFGNKNNLSIPTSVSTQSIDGITFTFHRNSDGAVTKIDVVGTATSNARLSWYIPDTFVQGETYKLTGWDVRNVTQGNTVNFAILFNGVPGSIYALNVTATELEYTCNKTGYTKIENAIYVQIGTTIDASIYPMNRKATVSDPTYEPYHASVADSLEQKADNSVIGTVEGANASKAWSAGEHFIKDGQFKEVTNPIASGEAINSGNTTDKPIADCLVYKAGDSIVISDNYAQIPIEGYFTSGGTAIFAFIRFDKPLVNVNGISFNSTSKIYVRGADGYILNNVLINTLKLTIQKVTRNGVLVMFEKTDSTAFDVNSSNKAVNIALSDCTVTLS